MTMDWANEEYVKLYRRKTGDDLMLSWQTLALWRALLVEFDRAGLLIAKRGPRELAMLTRIPVDVVEPALAELLEDGRLQVMPDGYFAPNFLDAQETPHSDKQRKREERQRRSDRARASAKLNNCEHDNVDVTRGHDGSRAVTPVHDESQDVTLSSLSSAKPLLREPPAITRDPGSTEQGQGTAPSTSVATLPLPASVASITVGAEPQVKLQPPVPLPAPSAPAAERHDPVRPASWHQVQGWWKFMLEADERCRASGIEPHGQPCGGRVCAGEVEKDVRTVAKNLAAQGFTPEEVDAKMRHVVLVAETECMRDGSRRWLNPLSLWHPKNAERAAMTSLELAARSKPAGARPPAPQQPAKRLKIFNQPS